MFKFPKMDKAIHFCAGWAIAATFMHFFDVWTSIFFASFLGACKEFWDMKGHGTPDVKDFAVTTLGGAVGGLICLLLTSL
jgi:hypothetical protein